MCIDQNPCTDGLAGPTPATGWPIRAVQKSEGTHEIIGIRCVLDPVPTTEQASNRYPPVGCEQQVPKTQITLSESLTIRKTLNPIPNPQNPKPKSLTIPKTQYAKPKTQITHHQQNPKPKTQSAKPKSLTIPKTQYAKPKTQITHHQQNRKPNPQNPNHSPSPKPKTQITHHPQNPKPNIPGSSTIYISRSVNHSHSHSPFFPFHLISSLLPSNLIQLVVAAAQLATLNRRIMADNPHCVSFHQFCLENLQIFWRFSIYGKPVALTNVPLLILRKILNVVKSCHDSDMSSGNLLENIIVINNEDVVLAGGPVPLDLVNPRLTMHNDLVAVWDLVLHAVNTTTPRVLPEVVRFLYDLYLSLSPFYLQGGDLRRIEFYLFNSPLFLDVMGKYLLYRKVLNLAEHKRRLFFSTLDLTGIGDWLASVRDPLLTAVRDHDNYINLPLYKTHEGSVKFYRNALGHLNQGQLYFMSDASIMNVLEDEIPMVLPGLFNAVVRGMDDNKVCKKICGMTFDDYLRAPITVFA